MPIYKSGQVTKAFKGDYAPVNVYKGSSKIAGWNNSEVSSESLSVVNTYNDDCAITINGKSTQAQTVQGKNLINLNKGSFVLSGVTVTKNVDGSFTFNGTTTANADFYLTTVTGYNNNLLTFQNLNYTFSVTVVSGNFVRSGTQLVRCVCFGKTNGVNNPNLLNCRIESNLFKETKLLDNTNILSSIDFVANGAGVTFNNYTIKVQLEIGANATAYEMFVPNAPSPSPQYPSTINSVSNFNLVSEQAIQCKNLIDVSKFVNRADTTATWDGNTLAVTGKWFVTVSMRVLKNTSYTLKFLASGAGEKIIKVYGTADGIALTELFVVRTAGYPATFNSGNYDRILVEPHASAGTIRESIFTDIQIELGSTATAYTPFVPNGADKIQEVNFAYNLRSLPNGVCDYIEIDNIAKTAKLIQNINQLVLNGTEGWELQGFANGITAIKFYFNTGYLGAEYDTPSYCSHLPYRLDENPITKIGHWLDFSDLFIRVLSANFPDLATFTTWLSTNPMSVQYQFDTPIITNLSYEAIKTYYPQTNIYHTGLGSVMEGKFRVIET